MAQDARRVITNKKPQNDSLNISSMSRSSFGLPENVQQYLIDNTVQEDACLRELREETATMPDGTMQISPEQGQLMTLLVKLTRAKKIVEVGVFTGYSSLRMAQALPAGGLIVACDISKEWTDIARKYWRRAGVDHLIQLQIGPAINTLESLISEHGKGSFDLAFIDADKANYRAYYELCLDLVRPGGVILIDNTLWGGSVADPEQNDGDTAAIRELNAFVGQDPRVCMSLIPISDGLSIVMKL